MTNDEHAGLEDSTLVYWFGGTPSWLHDPPTFRNTRRKADTPLRSRSREVLLESLSKRSLFLSHRWEPEVNISHARTLVVRGSKTSLNEAPYCMLTAAQVSISVDVVLWVRVRVTVGGVERTNTANYHYRPYCLRRRRHEHHYSDRWRFLQEASQIDT